MPDFGNKLFSLRANLSNARSVRSCDASAKMQLLRPNAPYMRFIYMHSYLIDPEEHEFDHEKLKF